MVQSCLTHIMTKNKEENTIDTTMATKTTMTIGSQENPIDDEFCSNTKHTSLPHVGNWSATDQVEDERHTFFQNDLNVCSPGAKFNDTVIDFSLDFLINKFGLRGNILRFTTHWYESHIHTTGKFNASGGISMRNIPDYFNYGFIVVPIHYSRHWSLAVVDTCSLMVYHMDSLPGYHNPEDIMDTLRNVIGSDKTCWTYEVIKVCKQGIPGNRGLDCGVHLIINVEKFLSVLAQVTVASFSISQVDFMSVVPINPKRKFLKLLMENDGDEEVAKAKMVENEELMDVDGYDEKDEGGYDFDKTTNQGEQENKPIDSNEHDGHDDSGHVYTEPMNPGGQNNYLKNVEQYSNASMNKIQELKTTMKVLLMTYKHYKNKRRCESFNRKWKGSKKGRKANIHRDFERAYESLLADYLGENPRYDGEHFRQQFRLPLQMYLDIKGKIMASRHSDYFKRKMSASRQWGAYTDQKLLAALQILAHGTAHHANELYLQVSKSLSKVCLKKFCEAITDIFKSELRYLTNNEFIDVMKEFGERGFPGCVGSIDCMHWVWKNCPTALAGLNKGKEKKPTIVIEAVCAYDLIFTHIFFGKAGSNNDINIINDSPLLHDILNGKFQPPINWKGFWYLLGDGIYPPWRWIVKTFSSPVTDAEKKFSRVQESVRKDIERGFGVLQSRWKILAQPSKYWYLDHMESHFRTCVILHNMIVRYNKANNCGHEIGITETLTPGGSFYSSRDYCADEEVDEDDTIDHHARFDADMEDGEIMDDEHDENTIDDNACMNGLKYKSVSAHYSLRALLLDYISSVSK